jgi:type VI secretion system secreted protein VgrG
MAAGKVTVASSLGADAFWLERMSARESLGGLFQFQLDLIAQKPNLDVSQLIGHDMSVTLDLPADKKRHFHGYVSRVQGVASSGRHARYRVELRPWLWLLHQTADCRIFQDKTIPEILRMVFDEHQAISHVDDRLHATYHRWDYCVQYRETLCNFVMRLMEQEGIYFFFQHEEKKHTLVLADGQGAHEATPGYESVPYYPPTQGDVRERDHLDGWAMSQSMLPGKYALSDYDFTLPRALPQGLCEANGAAKNEYEIYDYPGEFDNEYEGEGYARVRLEEAQTHLRRMTGQGNARGLSAGALFKLREFPSSDQNAEYLIVDSQCELAPGDVESEQGAPGEAFFRCNVTVIPSTTQFRAARVTPKPMVAGPQTAKVVGKKDQEIWTDQYGRVKVQFHWDRRGQSNEESSCWVRVSQANAGAGWGGIHVPRVGQEVVVSFLEGDPDRPLVTGRVYNGINSPPFELPSRAMVSGFKTDSTPGGGGYNEISLDDTAGEELVVVHAQRDMESTIEHDYTEWIRHDRSAYVTNDDLEEVEEFQTVKVGKDQKITVGQNHIFDIQTDSIETVKDGDKRLLIKKSNYAIEVAGNSSQKVTGDKTLQAKNISETATDKLSNKAKTVTVNASDAIKIDAKTGTITMTDQLTIQVGAARLVLKKSGEILINGMKIDVKGTGDVKIKGAKTTVN